MYTNRVILIIVSLLALICAGVVGSVVGQGDYFKLMVFWGAVCGLIYLGFLSSGWIAFGFLYSTLSFYIQPIGFALGAAEIPCLFAALYVFMMSWRHGAFKQTKASAQLTAFLIGVLLLLTYFGLHFFFNKANPFNSEIISWTNAAKTYLWMSGGFLLVAVAVLMPRGVWLPKNPVNFFAILLLIGALVNIGIRLYGIFALGVSTVNLGTGEEVQASWVFIPFINLTDNIYILRSLGPFCTLFAAAMITSKSPYMNASLSRFLGFLLVVVGLGASLASMGRAALILSIVLPMAVMILRKRVIFVMAFTAVGILFLVCARFAFEYDERLVPPGMQRALAIIPGMDMAEAKAGIDNSSDWRYEVFLLSLQDWKQSPRTIISGRCVYAFTERDAARLAGTDVFFFTMVSAVRRGSTHNLITDLLVPAGLVGLVLYFFTYGALMRGVLKIKKLAASESEVHDLAMIALVSLGFGIIIACIGGGFLQSLDALIIAALVVLANRERMQSGLT